MKTLNIIAIISGLSLMIASLGLIIHYFITTNFSSVCPTWMVVLLGLGLALGWGAVLYPMTYDSEVNK